MPIEAVSSSTISNLDVPEIDDENKREETEKIKELFIKIINEAMEELKELYTEFNEIDKKLEVLEEKPSWTGWILSFFGYQPKIELSPDKQEEKEKLEIRKKEIQKKAREIIETGGKECKELYNEFNRVDS